MSPYFEDSDIERVRQSTNIAELIGGYVTLKRKGSDLWGSCPFHNEKTASFHVRPDRGMYHCFGCGKGGNAVTFLMEIERLTFSEAIRFLAEKAGIELKTVIRAGGGESGGQERERIFNACSIAAKWFHSCLVAPSRPREATTAFNYLNERGITTEIVSRFQIGFAPPGWDGLVGHASRSGISGQTLVDAGLAFRKKDGEGFVDRFRARIIFPILGLAGKPIAFGARRLEGITPDDDAAKYVNSPETAIYHKGETLYGLMVARDDVRRAGKAYLVEGYIDLLALVQAGILNGVASLGTALTESQAKLIGRFAGKVVVVYDGDSAGINAAIRAADVLTLAGVEARMAMLPAGEDPDSYLRKEGREALQIVLTNEKSFVQFRLEAAGASGNMGQTELLGAVRGIMETIRSISDPLQRDLLLGELSKLTNLRRETLDKASSRTSKPSEERNVAKIAISTDPEQIPERDLLRALLSNPSLIAEAMEIISSEQIEHTGLRAVYLALEQAWLSGKPIVLESIIDQISDPILKSFLAESATRADELPAGEAREEMLGCVKALQKRTLMRERDELQQQIRQSQPGEGSSLLLLGRLAELNRQIKSLLS